MLEKLVLATFSPTLLSSSSSVIGAHVAMGGTRQMEPWSLALSICVVTVVVAFHVLEVRTLIRFRRLDKSTPMWQGNEKPLNNAEVDDPCLALLGKFRILRPKLRGRGGFEAPDEDAVEPARTERALRRALSCGFWRYCGGEEERLGDVLETLPMWLDDANEGTGIFFVITQNLLQLGIAMTTGFMHAHPWLMTQPGGVAINLLLITMQVALVVWVMSKKSNDLYTEGDAWIGFISELTSSCLMFASNRLSQAASAAGTTTPQGAEDLRMSLVLAQSAARLLVLTAFVPMALTAYDSFVVPVVQMCWKSEMSYAETAAQVVVAAVTLPIAIAQNSFGMGSGGMAQDFASAMEGSAVELASAVAEGGEEVDEEEALSAPPEEPPRAALTNAAKKRLKRVEYLTRVRRKAALKVKERGGRTAD